MMFPLPLPLDSTYIVVKAPYPGIAVPGYPGCPGTGINTRVPVLEYWLIQKGAFQQKAKVSIPGQNSNSQAQAQAQA